MIEKRRCLGIADLAYAALAALFRSPGDCLWQMVRKAGVLGVEFERMEHMEEGASAALVGGRRA